MAHRARTPSSEEQPQLPSFTPLQECEVGDKHTFSSSPPNPDPKRFRHEINDEANANEKRALMKEMALYCLNFLTMDDYNWASVKLAFLQKQAWLEDQVDEETPEQQLLLPCSETIDTTMSDVPRGLAASRHAVSSPPPQPTTAPAVPERAGLRAPPIKPSSTGKNAKATPHADATLKTPAAPARSTKTALPASPYKAALCSNLPPQTAPQHKLDGFTTVARPSKRVNKNTPGPCELILSSEGKKGKVTSAKQIRDQINCRRGMLAIGVRLTGKGNLAVTCANEKARNELWASRNSWLATLRPLGWTSVAATEKWQRLVAHGIPVDELQNFHAEFKASNGIETRGTCRLLKRQRANQKAVSVVFSVATPEEAAKCLQGPIFFAAQKVPIVKYLYV